LIQTALVGEAVDAGPALIFIADETMRYVAVNEFACSALGYTREELLALPVSEVAREPQAPMEFDEMLARGFRHGTALLTRRDGTTVDYLYRAQKTQAAGMTFFVSVGFLA
jgi:PAS domain S-box-containing protein